MHQCQWFPHSYYGNSLNTGNPPSSWPSPDMWRYPDTITFFFSPVTYIYIHIYTFYIINHLSWWHGEICMKHLWTLGGCLKMAEPKKFPWFGWLGGAPLYIPRFRDSSARCGRSTELRYSYCCVPIAHCPIVLKETCCEIGKHVMS